MEKAKPVQAGLFSRPLGVRKVKNHLKRDKNHKNLHGGHPLMQIFPFHHHYIAATKPTEDSGRGVCRAIAGQPSRRNGMSPPALIVSKNTVPRLHFGWKNTPRRDVKADGTEERRQRALTTARS